MLHTSHKNVSTNLYLHARLNLIFPSLIRFRLNICLALSINKIIRFNYLFPSLNRGHYLNRAGKCVGPTLFKSLLYTRIWREILERLNIFSI